MRAAHHPCGSHRTNKAATILVSFRGGCGLALFAGPGARRHRRQKRAPGSTELHAAKKGDPTFGAEEQAEEKPAVPAGALKDGEYSAEGKGIGGKVPVTVIVEGGKISAVTVGDNSETQGIGSKAVEQLPDLIVAANGTAGVDGVSGATITSKAIFTAVEECLAQASA